MLVNFRLHEAPLPTHGTLVYPRVVGGPWSTKEAPANIEDEDWASTPSGVLLIIAAKRNKEKDGPSNSRTVISTAAEGHQVPVPVDDFVCPDCNRSFKTKRGLGVHRRSQHPTVYHQDALTELRGREVVKKRWTEEEEMNMAKREAEILILNDDTININQELHLAFPNRTVEAIKGKRRAAKYKKRVTDLYKALSEARDSEKEISDHNGDLKIATLKAQSTSHLQALTVNLPEEEIPHSSGTKNEEILTQTSTIQNQQAHTESLLVSDYFMNEDTITYVSPETYINTLTRIDVGEC